MVSSYTNWVVYFCHRPVFSNAVIYYIWKELAEWRATSDEQKFLQRQKRIKTLEFYDNSKPNV